MDVPLQDYRCQELVTYIINCLQRIQLISYADYFIYFRIQNNQGVPANTCNKPFSILIYGNVFLNRCVIQTNSLMSTHFERCSQFLIMHNTGGGFLEIAPELDVMKVRYRLEHLSRIFHFRYMWYFLKFQISCRIIGLFMKHSLFMSVEYFPGIFLWNIFAEYFCRIFIIYKMLI